MITDIKPDQKHIYNSVVDHPLQSYEWGEFREKTNVKVVRRAVFKDDKIISGFTVTIHRIPKSPWSIGYLPKCVLPNQEILDELRVIGKENKCIFIQIEPNTIIRTYDAKSNELTKEYKIKDLTVFEDVVLSAHPLFTKFTFIIDLTKSDEQLFAQMHPKTRYNVRLAQKHGVEISQSQDFENYWKLMSETTSRQKFYAHTKEYHKKLWQTLSRDNNDLKLFMLAAEYKHPEEKVTNLLASWVLFTFKNTLYYPYGASSSLFRNVMASNLMMWEAIQFGKKIGLTKFDMWGSLGPSPDQTDPWYGFHRLKIGYNPELVEFIGSYDLVLNKKMYSAYKVANRVRWKLLKLKK